MARAARIVLIDPSGVRHEVEVTPLPFRMGRQAGNELTLRDSRISRQQAQIVTANGSFVLEDLGSRHGTFVDGKRIVRHELHPKETIDFGVPDSYKIIFLGQEATLEEILERVEVRPPENAGSRELYHLGVLLEVARTLGTGLSLEEVLTAVVDAAIQVTRTERGVLLLANAQGELTTAVARDAQRGSLRPDQVEISSGVLKRVVSTRRELIVTDTGEDVAMQQHASVARLELHTIVAIPVDKLPMVDSRDATISTRQGELLGVLYLDSHSPSTAYSQLDREVLRNLAREAATVIENARLFAASRAKARMDHEIEIASEIQRGLLPKNFPEVPHVAVAGATVSCLTVGGDCFDVVQLGGDRYGFFVGDVAGKGIPAALLASLLQGVFYTTAALDLPCGEVAARINKFLYERSSEERYATVFYAVLSPQGQLEYINAGHVPPFVRRKSGQIEQLASASFPIGLFNEADYQCGHSQLAAGDFMVIYSDGVPEASNGEGEMFGEERLLELVAKTEPGTAQELMTAIHSAIRTFTGLAPQSDDITLLVVQYRGAA